MHHEHDLWRQEDNLWRDELAIWEKEINEVFENLPRLDLAVRQFAAKLQRHAAAIRLYEQDFSSHEASLAEFERGETPEELVGQSQGHNRECEQHEVRRRVHDELKTQHHILLSNWTPLFAALVQDGAAKPAPVLSDH
jgi:hypothetical protein